MLIGAKQGFFGAGFQAKAVTLDGSTNYLSRSDFTGNANGKSGIFSCWLNFNGGNGVNQKIWYSQNGYVEIKKDTDNKIYILAYHPSSGIAVQLISTSTFTDATGWIHVLASWDLANTTAHLYINGVDDAGTVTANNLDIDYTQTNHVVGAFTGGSSNFLNADIAELYFNFSEYLDISDSANRQKFISANGKPVDFGDDGSEPTGSQPIVYLTARDGAAFFGDNYGDGGNFTRFGSGYPLAPTSPSD